jgi:AcrR family transcriptional regulator
MSDSRSTLLEAAAAEFAKNGLRGTRIQDIVKAAGVNERMIYHHFGSKEGLYRAVMLEQRFRMGHAWAPAFEKAATMEPYDGLRLIFGALFDVIVGSPQIAALFAHEALVDEPLGIPDDVEFPFDVFRTLYERGQAEGTFAPGIPFEFAYMTAVATLMSAVIFHPRAATILLRGARFDPVEHREVLLDQVFKGMSG